MTLRFKILIADDAADNIREAIDSLSEHLDSRGFTLSFEILNEFTEEVVKNVCEAKGKDFDLVIVDPD